MATNRESWGTNFGFLMAAIGSAVGLGNIWAFPYKMANNGGFAFLVVYLILAFFLGFVVMLAELTLGRKSGLGCIGTYQKLSKRFKWVGYLGVLSAFLIVCFYTVLGAYCVKYFILNFGDLFHFSFGSAGRNGGQIFEDLITNPWECTVYTLFFLAACYTIVVGGIRQGIEKFSAYAMPALFVMLLVVIVRSVTLDGAGEGLKFMFAPNFKPFEENFIGVLAAASNQLFFSLSLGMAIMITYGSYLSKSENLQRNAVVIVLADTTVAVLAGVAVIPAAIALGGEGAALAGPKLLYITLQNVFIAMGSWGPVIGMVFYGLVVIAAVTSAISLAETVVTYFLDRYHIRGKEGPRRFISLWVFLAIGFGAIIVSADGLGSNGLWVPFQSTFGVHGWNDCWLDLLDAASEGFMMPFGALMTMIFIGYEMGVKSFGDEVRASGDGFKTEVFFTVCCKYIAPVILVFVLYNQLVSFGIL